MTRRADILGRIRAKLNRNPENATAGRAAIEETLAEGWRTRDIADAATPAKRVVGTAEMGSLVADRL